MALSEGLWIYLVVSALVLLFSVVGNFLLIYCVIRIRKLRSVTNVLICNLAACDIVLAGFIIPQKLHDMSHEEHFYEGLILCKLVNFGPIFVITASVYTLVFISFERRRSVIDKEQLTHGALYKLIPFVWLFGLAVSFPTLVEYVVIEMYNENDTNNTHISLSCGSHMADLFSITNAVFVVFVSYLVPSILIFSNYARVAVYVWKTSKNMQSGTSSSNSDSASFRIVKSRFRIVKLLVAVAAIFIFSWLPFFVFLLIAKITHKDASSDASGFVNLLLVGLATFSTAYNVILYGVFNPSFSHALFLVFKQGNIEQEAYECDSTYRQTQAEPSRVQTAGTPTEQQVSFNTTEEPDMRTDL